MKVLFAAIVDEERLFLTESEDVSDCYDIIIVPGTIKAAHRFL